MSTNDIIQEYSCFLHPQEKGTSLKDTCPICEKPYEFPLVNHPRTINGKEVVKCLDRGFYGAVFKTKHPNRELYYAVKVIPVKTYTDPEEGYNKNFDEEMDLFIKLSEINLVAPYIDDSRETLLFGDENIPCFFVEMKYIRGPTLREVKQRGVENPRKIAQIATDLLDFIGELNSRNVYHNDLHDGNIKIMELSNTEKRGDVIDRSVKVYILDIGSAAEKPKSGPGHRSDLEWIASHIDTFLSKYVKNHTDIEQPIYRLCLQLKQIVDYCREKDPIRMPRAEDMKERIYASIRAGSNPYQMEEYLSTIVSHYNAKTLPPILVPFLFYEPEGEIWTKELMEPGTQLIVGMRGCGKTMLLRAFDWAARSYKKSNESFRTMLDRVTEDEYLGCFASCSLVVKIPRPKSYDEYYLPYLINRVFLSYVAEILRHFYHCSLQKIGELHFVALESLAEFVQEVCPWFIIPDRITDIYPFEKAIDVAFRNTPNDIDTFNPEDIFEKLALIIKRLNSIWENKRVFFLLDDVSTRNFPLEIVGELTSNLLKSGHNYCFKLSSETQTAQILAAGDSIARNGRDYRIFDFGKEVYRTVKRRRVSFVNEILRRRVELARDPIGRKPYKILGRKTIKSISEDIRNGVKDEVYWGIDALTAICVGDIGDILFLYETILSEVRNGEPETIDPKIQHAAIVNYSKTSIGSLIIREKEWELKHLINFAMASNRELIASEGVEGKNGKPRYREYGEIDIIVPSDELQEILNKIIILIDEGIFVFIGVAVLCQDMGNTLLSGER